MPANRPPLTRAKQLRLDRDLSVPELSKLSGINRDSIYAIERGNANPHRRTLQALASVLGVKPSELLLPAFPESDAA